MSKTVKLVYPGTGETVAADFHKEGALVSGPSPDRMGSRSAEMSVTGNYHGHIVRVTGWEDGLRELYGRTARETIPALERAVAELGTEQSVDYWESTPGNAGAALATLLSWAREFPDGEWRVY